MAGMMITREGAMSDDVPAYGLWGLVLLNSAIFIFFAFSFFKPQTGRDWRSLVAFSAFPLTLYSLFDRIPRLRAAGSRGRSM